MKANDTTELIFRRATRDDVAHIVRLLADDPLGSARERSTDPLPVSYLDAFDEIDSDPNNELMVVERDGLVIGTFQLTFIPGLSFQGARRAQIEAVRVDAPYRSLGIGARMFEWVIDHARQRGCRFLQLTTNAARTDAHRFYDRLGFASSHVGMKLDLQQ
jgi:GNAT superfamily N-acetyltransferase